ncbi:MAG: sodium:solute symporter family protein [Sphingobacteriia bacterium]|nr:sodium:solute symporter family protein [Sphingobacteriia bacterium]
MEHLNFDSIIVLLYLATTLFIGMYAGRNIKNMKEYAVGDYKFSTSTLTATITATWIGAGSAIGTHEKVYQFGIVWIFIFLGGVVAIFIFQLLAPKIIKFKGSLSTAEMLTRWYGPKVRTIAGICVAICSIGMVGSQIRAVGYLFNEFFDISPVLGIMIGAGIVVAYSSFGGIKAVTYTDVLQFAFFVVAIPLIANVALGQVGGYKVLLDNVPAEHFKLFPNYGKPIEYLTLFFFFAIPFWDSCLIQRVLMARDRNQIVSSFKATAFVMLLFYIICGQTALSALVLNPNLDPNKVLYFVINNYLPLGIKGLGIAGLLAVVMSTADSYLNNSSVAIIHDIVNPSRKTPLSSKQELFITKLSTLTIGCLSIIFAIQFKSITEAMIKSWVLWGAVMVVPLYGAVLGIRSNAKTFILGALGGLTTVVIWAIFDIEARTGVDSVMPALATNLTVFTLASLYYHKLAPEKLYKPNVLQENFEGFDPQKKMVGV